MTNREFFNAIINSNVNSELIDFAKAEIDKLDARNDKRRNTLTKEQIANEQLKVQIVELIGGGSMIAKDIATALEISTQKVSALCKQLVDNGTLAKGEVTVKGKGKVLSYSVIKGE